MTNKSLLLAASLAVALTSGAFASSSNSQATTAGTPKPRPVTSSIVKPTGLPQNFRGAVIDVEFALDQNGQPRDVRVLSVYDSVLKRQLTSAFRQWRFEPGVNDPAQASKRFILPVQLDPEA